jgi:hypothetical protein
MQIIHDLIGRELPSETVNRALRSYAQSARVDEVGAVHVTCSDESEREVAESFQHWFADSLLPELKFSSRAPLRTANLGARYEWGAIRVAEKHFATPAARSGLKLMMVKINAHVGITQASGAVRYGVLNRYECDSACCSALNALLANTRHPAVDELTAAFNYDGLMRLDMLKDENTVAPELRILIAGILNARIQARSAIVDIQDYQPVTPTIFVVLPCVTLNRRQRDTEITVGAYWADSRVGTENAQYLGLSDDPSKFQVSLRHGSLVVSDGQIEQARDARNHRVEVVEQWRARREPLTKASDPRIREIAERSKKSPQYSATMTRETLKTLLWLAADISPIPLSIMLFAKGIAGVHRLYSVHQLARGAGDVDQARDIIEEVSDQIAKIPADRAQAAIDAIVRHYHGPTTR